MTQPQLAWFAYTDPAANGRIMRVRRCAPVDRLAGIEPGKLCIPVADRVDPDTHYIKGRRLFARPAIKAGLTKTSIIADGIDATVLSPLPKPCTLTVDGEPIVCNDGRVELAANVPGTYEIAIDHWPYLPWQGTVTAT